jgi:hypothetical protein
LGNKFFTLAFIKILEVFPVGVSKDSSCQLTIEIVEAAWAIGGRSRKIRIRDSIIVLMFLVFKIGMNIKKGLQTPSCRDF